MEKPNIIDKRHLRQEDISKPDYIPFLGGRPLRETVIGRDDLLDLTILLNTTTTIDELLRAIDR